MNTTTSATTSPETSSGSLIFDTTSERFVAEVIERSRSVTVAVDLWAPWCGPCRALAPLLEQLVRQYGGKLAVAKVNVDQEPAIASQLAVRSIPDVRIFKDGKMVDGFVGVQPPNRLQALFDKHVGKGSPGEEERARQLLRNGDARGAADLLRGIVAADAGNTDARIDLADALARLGEVDEAEKILQGLPANAGVDPRVAAIHARIYFRRHAPRAAELDQVRSAATGGLGNLADMHRLAAHEILEGDAERGLLLLLTMMQRDRKFQDDLGRRSLLQAFALLGESDDRVKEYRRRMAGMLY